MVFKSYLASLAAVLWLAVMAALAVRSLFPGPPGFHPLVVASFVFVTMWAAKVLSDKPWKDW